ncbi:MAG: hypothetical protein ACYDA8_07475 [Deferrisomatales bacterium]
MTLLLHALNYLLATAMWFVLGRLFLSMFIRNVKNPIWQLFLLLTDPVYRLTARMTGNRVPEQWLGPVSILWLVLGRVLLVALVPR